MKKHTTFLILFLLFAVPAVRASEDVIPFPLGSNRYSRPELLAPCTDNFDLKGRDTVEFRWAPFSPAGFREYIFKLYRGYNTTDENLILRRQMPASTYSFTLPAKDFAVGEVYTWELTGVFLDGRKTDTASCSFQIKIGQ